MGNILDVEVKGRRLFEICTNAAFNDLHIKIGGTPVRYDDCEATYSLSTDDKLTKPRRAELLMFLRGVIACYRSF